MSTFNRALDLRPESFNGVRAMNTIRPLPFVVVDVPMSVSLFAKSTVSPHFVRADIGTAFNVFEDDRGKSLSLNIGDNLSHNITVTLDHSKYDGFLLGLPVMLFPGFNATNVSFINLYMAVKLIVSVNLAHVLSYFVSHSPSGLVGNRKLSLQFLGWYAVPRGGKEIHSVKPLLKGCMAVLEGCISHRVNMVAAKLARISRDGSKLVKLALLLTASTLEFLSEAHFHQMRQAGIVIRELFEELLNVHGVTSMNLEYVNYLRMSRG